MATDALHPVFGVDRAFPFILSPGVALLTGRGVNGQLHNSFLGVVGHVRAVAIFAGGAVDIPFHINCLGVGGVVPGLCFFGVTFGAFFCPRGRGRRGIDSAGQHKTKQHNQATHKYQAPDCAPSDR